MQLSLLNARKHLITDDDDDDDDLLLADLDDDDDEMSRIKSTSSFNL